MRASTMQLERREAIELVLSFRASLLSEVATRLSSFDLKTSELGKSYKRSGALNLKHREARSCDREINRSNKSYTTYWTYIELFRRGLFGHCYSRMRFDDRRSQQSLCISFREGSNLAARISYHVTRFAFRDNLTIGCTYDLVPKTK